VDLRFAFIPFLAFGEFNEHNKLHGKGISIDSSGSIEIGYWNNGADAPGNFITIWSGGVFSVGEYYLKDG